MKATAIVCTRDRPASCSRTVASVLRAARPETEILLIDQSSGSETREAVEALGAHGAVRYVASETRGLSAARNHGARLARGDLILFTDDDCIAEAQWVDAWRRAFEAQPNAGVGFGQVSCPPFDPARGYTAGFDVREGSHGAELFRLGTGQVGMGANLALRRRLWEQLGGFDEGLGAGARFVSAEDSDFAYRAVRRGHRILHSKEARVWHYGYREGAHASELMRGYVAGIAAMYVKHVRCGDWMAVALLASDLRHHVTNMGRNFLACNRPFGVGGLLFYLGGIGRSWRWPVDRERRVYRVEIPGPADPPTQKYRPDRSTQGGHRA